ncbi:MAG: hypothetical protein ABSF26_06605 [Thermoguttaceae bacterium]|jgi:uncharacterized membrane protein YeaQ/YmgE (transglycosylase-associated protein family)
MRNFPNVGAIVGTFIGILAAGLMVWLNHMNVVQNLWMPLVGALLGGSLGTRFTYARRERAEGDALPPDTQIGLESSAATAAGVERSRRARRFGIYAGVLGAILGIPATFRVTWFFGVTGKTVGLAGLATLGCVGAALFGALCGALVPGLRHGALLGAKVAMAIAAVVCLALCVLVWVAFRGVRW